MRVALLALAAFLPGVVRAQPVSQTCTGTQIVPGMEAWSRSAPGPVAIGRASRLTLAAADGRVLSPGRSPKPGTYAGRFPLQVARAGTYCVALSPGAWIDLVRDGIALPSTGHGHGPPCSGIAKMVSFALQPGRYDRQVSEATAAEVTVLIAP